MKGGTPQRRNQLQCSHFVPMIELSHVDDTLSEIPSTETLSSAHGALNYDTLDGTQFDTDTVPQIDSDLTHQMPSLSLSKDPDLGVTEETNLSKQIDTVRRNQWMSLREKRRKKAELVESDNQKTERTIGILRVAKYSFSMSLQKFWGAVQGFAYTFELWYGAMKLIEGNFGSGMASYFKFLRWLFLLNCSMLMISFLVLPQILSQFFSNFDESTPQSLLRNQLGYLLHENSFKINEGLNGTALPFFAATQATHKNISYAMNPKFSIDNLLTGGGFLTHTSLYYGFYTNQTLELVKGYTYHMPVAYFFSLFACYLLFFVVVSFSMARSYRISFIETKGGQKNVHALKVFCGWDFSIANPKAAALNHKRMYNEIKEVLNETEDQNPDSSFFSLLTNVIIHMSLNVMFCLLLAGTGFLMWDLLGRHSQYVLETNAQSLENGTRSSILMAIFISIVMNIFPKGFSRIVQYEGYSNPRTALYVTLLRTFLLNCVVIAVLLIYWLRNSQSECWQTSLGQEIYRLVITDFIVSILILEVSQVAWSWVSRKCLKSSGFSEFDIAWNSLNLIYNQTLLLVGLYFSPLLSAVVVLKLFITFYVKKAGIFFNVEQSKSWKAAQTQTVFLILIFIVSLGVFLLLGYIMIELPPSSCGPFQGNENTYRIVVDSILQLENNHLFWKIVMFLVKPGIVAAVLVAMSAAVFMLSARAQAHSKSAHVLQEMVISEAKDKAYLFKLVRKLEKAGCKRRSISSLSSFSHTPLSERKLRRTRFGDKNRTSHSPSKVLADSSIPLQHFAYDGSPQGSMGSRGEHSNDINFPLTISSGTSRFTIESEFSEIDSSDGQYLN